MFSGKFLNTKERKEIYKMLNDQFGCEFKSTDALVKTNKDKIYIINQEVKDVDFEKLRVDKVGSYFGGLQSDGIRLSLEGSEIIGPLATTNVIEISKDQMKLWLRGEDLKGDENQENALVLIKCGKDWLGCGKLRDGEILNFTPKTRRITAKE